MQPIEKVISEFKLDWHELMEKVLWAYKPHTHFLLELKQSYHLSVKYLL